MCYLKYATEEKAVDPYYTTEKPGDARFYKIEDVYIERCDRIIRCLEFSLVDCLKLMRVSR